MLAYLVPCRTWAGIVQELGNGSQVLPQNTVRFAFWVAATQLHDYRAAILACIEARGDRDTTAAIVSGIVATYTERANHGMPAPRLHNPRTPPEHLQPPVNRTE